MVIVVPFNSISVKSGAFAAVLMTIILFLSIALGRPFVHFMPFYLWLTMLKDQFYKWWFFKSTCPIVT